MGEVTFVPFHPPASSRRRWRAGAVRARAGLSRAARCKPISSGDADDPAAARNPPGSTPIPGREAAERNAVLRELSQLQQQPRGAGAMLYRRERLHPTGCVGGDGAQ